MDTRADNTQDFPTISGLQLWLNSDRELQLCPADKGIFEDLDGCKVNLKIGIPKNLCFN